LVSWIWPNPDRVRAVGSQVSGGGDFAGLRGCGDPAVGGCDRQRAGAIGKLISGAKIR